MAQLKFIKGLMKDTGYVDQPDGAWRHANNILMDKIQGAITNEGGNIQYKGWENSYTIIGIISTTDDILILFAIQTEVSVALEDRRSAIFLIDTKEHAPSTRTVYNPGIAGWRSNVPDIDVNMKFSPEHPILGTYKINGKGELIIYWTDDFNPPRCLNVTRQLKWQDDYNAGITATGTHEHLYGVNPMHTNNKTYIDRLNLFPHAGPVPHIEFQSINSGGGLQTGSYFLALCYVDVDNVQTNFVTVDGPIFIVEDSESVSPIERYDGAPPNSQTGKSISWEITNINTDYDYIRPVVIRRMGVDSEKTMEADAYEAEKVFQLNDIPLPYGEKGPIELTYTGLEGYEEKSTPDIIVDTISYDKVKTIAQLDDTMYLGNMEATVDIGYQKYANFIKLSPVNKVFEDFDPYEPIIDNLQYGYNSEIPSVSSDRGNGYRDIMNTYKYRGYQRDEVYAFYIAFVLNDGTMSYAYHIPGRAAQTINGKLENDFVDSSEIDEAVQYIPAEFSNQSRYFHFFEASNQGPNTRDMNYWENANEFYPNTSDYEYWDAETDTINNTTSGNNLLNLNDNKVRHHHFCSNRGTYPTIVEMTSDPLVMGTASQDFKFYFKDIDNVSDPATGGGANLSFRTMENLQCGTPTVGKWVCTSSTTCCSRGGTCEKSPQPGTTIRIKYDAPNCFGCSCRHVFEGEVVYANGSQVTLNNLTDIAGWGKPSHMTSMNKPRGAGYWHAPATTVSGTIKHTVQALGFELEDIKIPTDIAKKVQGFRIYYAKRKQADRRILGQNNVIPMRSITGELDDCHPDNSGGQDETFWAAMPFASDANAYPIGDTDNDAYSHFTFHDFNLLRSKGGIAHATHLTVEYETTFYSFKGYGFGHKGLKSGDHCFKHEIRNNFHIGSTYDTPRNLGPGILSHIRPLKERCRTYLIGDTVFDGTSLGFGGLISNMQGESCIALALHPSAVLPAFSIDASGTYNNEIVQSANMSYVGESEKLYHVNLHAFKTDMYNSIDTQDLIWTGFEVLGDDLDNFIVGKQYNSGTTLAPSLSPADFKTSTIKSDGIWGGDTYICRHGWRTSFKPTFTGWASINYISGHYNIVESPDNINFRHIEGDSSTYFPGASALSLLKAGVVLTKPQEAEEGVVNADFTMKENMKYNTNYSGGNDVRPAFPLPIKDNTVDKFPTRTHRSAKSDPGGLVDNFRVFLANDYKDLPKNRGELWRILSFNNLLYFHMEDTIMKTQGKQTMQMGDGSEAFVGSGDLFAQEPTELVQTDDGYGGTRNQWAGIVTKYGYFFIDSRTSRIFLVQDQLMDITTLGIENWFQRNIPFELQNYGMPIELDNPTGAVGMGFHSIWDDHHQRILLTKREWKPTQKFIDGVDECIQGGVPIDGTHPVGCIRWSDDTNKFQYYGLTKSGSPKYKFWDIEWGDISYYKDGGWTVSFRPDLKIWVSFHSYVPSLWTSTSRELMSILQNNETTLYSGTTLVNSSHDRLFRHHDTSNPGKFYNEIYPSIFEFIDNAARDKTKQWANISYLADVIDQTSTEDSYGTVFAENVPGFTSFLVYNTHQTSGEIDIEYMMNTRKIDNEWKLNRFRDMSLTSNQTNSINVGPFNSSNYGVTNLNVAGTVTDSVELTTFRTNNMFLYDGMHKNISTSFIDTTKPWHEQRRFTDKFLGIRLICSNNENNLVNLYSVSTAAREYTR